MRAGSSSSGLAPGSVEAVIGEPYPALEFDLATLELLVALEHRHLIERISTVDAVVDGICVWFDVVFDDGTVLTTSPLAPNTSWGNRMYRLDREGRGGRAAGGAHRHGAARGRLDLVGHRGLTTRATRSSIRHGRGERRPPPRPVDDGPACRWSAVGSTGCFGTEGRRACRRLRRPQHMGNGLIRLAAGHFRASRRWRGSARMCRRCVGSPSWRSWPTTPGCSCPAALSVSTSSS